MILVRNYCRIPQDIFLKYRRRVGGICYDLKFPGGDGTGRTLKEKAAKQCVLSADFQ